MALVTTKEMFQKAYAGGYAIGAFNFNSMEVIQAITTACREEKSPVILQVSQDVLENHNYYKHLVQAAVEECEDLPIAWNRSFYLIWMTRYWIFTRRNPLPSAKRLQPSAHP